MQLDLAELYRKLKKYDQAGRVMDDALEERRRRTDGAGSKESKNGARSSGGDTPFDFTWMVARLNETLIIQEDGTKNTSASSVSTASAAMETVSAGILDIFGFEIFHRLKIEKSKATSALCRLFRVARSSDLPRDL